MPKHRNPRPKVSKQPPAHNFDPAILTTVSLVYEDLVEVEALAVTADEAVTNLPPKPRASTVARWPGCTRSSARPRGARRARWNAARSWWRRSRRPALGSARRADPSAKSANRFKYLEFFESGVDSTPDPVALCTCE